MEVKKTLTVYPLSRNLLFRMVRFFVKKTVGVENIPDKGPYLVACKHMGAIDGLFIASVIIPKINQKIHFITNISKWGWFWEEIVAKRWGGCIPFEKDNPRMCLDIALDYLKKGKVVGIFPEGILQDYDEKKHRAKTGVARLAIWTRVPILPIGLVNDITVRHDLPRLYRRRQMIKNTLLNPHTMEIHIGEPFELNEYYDVEIDHDKLVEATNKVMDKIEKITQINYK
ncbi:1-acyl-sn-glycerol-3-phosphate acyltransferase [Patescibacteria group bacterium]|nr:1-acyl-sn-glycerol-3-phosphate acyltransferase [Patescibacteria group bacterium]MBU0964492.1 1-acyl-sn-glycerol-3-phosphate acyltransferase [Patescibacteria group bacterium]